MGRYPKAARAALLKCISCNAPATQTVGERYVCVECGDAICSSGQPVRQTGQKDDAGQELQHVANDD